MVVVVQLRSSPLMQTAWSGQGISQSDMHANLCKWGSSKKSLVQHSRCQQTNFEEVSNIWERIQNRILSHNTDNVCWRWLDVLEIFASVTWGLECFSGHLLKFFLIFNFGQRLYKVHSTQLHWNWLMSQVENNCRNYKKIVQINDTCPVPELQKSSQN